MKVGVITYCLGYNYGAMMQAYATIKAIESIGHEVVLINYHHPWSFGLNPKDWRNYVGRNLRSIKYKLTTLWKQRTLRKCFSPMWALWPLSQYYGYDAELLAANPPECDCLITGSDQTWNTSYARKLFAPYFLNFGGGYIKRISYASSLGNIPFSDENKEWIIDRLRKYSAISVRENKDVAYLKSMGLENVVHMPDPTMIVDRSLYDSFIAKESHHAYDAVIYMLGEKNTDNERYVPKILEANGIDLNNTLNINPQNFHCKKAINRITTVPAWVDAIAHARFVVTNSFHGVVFCLIYNRPFIFVKFKGKKAGGNSRIESLLNSTSEAFRMIDITEDFDLTQFMRKPDFSINLQSFRAKGVAYLTSNI